MVKLRETFQKSREPSPSTPIQASESPNPSTPTQSNRHIKIKYIISIFSVKMQKNTL